MSTQATLKCILTLAAVLIVADQIGAQDISEPNAKHYLEAQGRAEEYEEGYRDGALASSANLSGRCLRRFWR